MTSAAYFTDRSEREMCVTNLTMESVTGRQPISSESRAATTSCALPLGVLASTMLVWASLSS